MRASKIGVLDVGSDFGLDVWREKVALDRRDTSRRLGRYDVDADNTSVRGCPVDCDLGIGIRWEHVVESINRRT